MARKEPLVYYQPDIETMSREDLEALQLERMTQITIQFDFIMTK